MLTPFGVYAFVYPFGIGLLLLGWLPPSAGWVGGALLSAQGLAVAAWLVSNFGAGRGLLGAGLIAAGAWALEAAGVTSGLPFGRYSYTPVLGAWLGPVPLAIPCAWVASVGAAIFTARRLLPAGRVGGAAVVLAGAALATAQDLVLETVATRVQGYWAWAPVGAPYYGVPWANFAAWFAAGLVFGGLLEVVVRVPGVEPLRYHWLPPLLYGMNLLMFGLLNAAWGFWLPATLAAGLLILLIGRLR